MFTAHCIQVQRQAIALYQECDRNFIYQVKNITIMEIKTVSYQRVLNLGNFESKRLEMSAGLEPEDDIHIATRDLIEMVEGKIREHVEYEVISRIKLLETRANNLRQQISYLEEELGRYKSQEDDLTVFTGEETNPDDIPFNNANQTTSTPDAF